MAKLKRFGIALLLGCLLSSVSTVSAQKIDATVLYRQNSDTGYTVLVPGFAPEGAVDCAADIANDACSQAVPTAAPGQPSLSVTGTTLSLLLPDGRVAVVNCPNRYSFKGTAINRRTCAMPLVEHVEAQFAGSRATLKWLIGSNDRKIESEKYTVVAFLDKR
jgi:hypothetical protein